MVSESTLLLRANWRQVIPSHHVPTVPSWTSFRQTWILCWSGGSHHIKPRCAAAGVRQVGDRQWKIPTVAEYYNPSPVAIPYRGHTDRLFKRDFAVRSWTAKPEEGS